MWTTIKEKFMEKNFIKYLWISIITTIITIVISTILLYVGREWFLISIIIINPIIKIIEMAFGFVFKYYMYKKNEVSFVK